MANQWFRSWHGAPTDTKWLAIGRRAKVAPGIVSAIAWALFDHASQAEDRGSIDGFDVEAYAAFSGFDEQQVVDVLKALEDKEILIGRRFKAWDGRQPQKEDYTAKDRKRKQRDNERKESVTPCHAPSHHVTTDKIRLDKDKIKKERRGAVALKPENISQKIWDDFLRQRKTKFTDTALEGIQREAEKAGLAFEEAIRMAVERGWQSFKADWVTKGQENGKRNQKYTADDALREVIDEIRADSPSGAPELCDPGHLRQIA